MRMLSDIEVPSCSRKCAATEQLIEPGEIYYSVLQIQGAETVRADYRTDAWEGPPESCLAWWRARLPSTRTARAQLAPRDVLFNFLVKLAQIPAEVEFRYVLALVMLRRRILRHQDSTIDEFGQEWLNLHCPHRDQQLNIQVAVPDSKRAEALQQRLIDLLYGDPVVAGTPKAEGNQKEDHHHQEERGTQNQKRETRPVEVSGDRHDPSTAPACPANLGSLLLLMLLFCCTGATCSRSLRYPFASLGPPAPEVLSAGASLEQILGAVNQNTSRIRSFSSNNASISVPGMPAAPLLRGNLVAQRPQRFRLQASTALTGPEVDLGTNEELFWFWVRRNQPPALYYGRHDQFVGSSAQQVMPVEPAWFLSALGMAEFLPTDFHEGPRPHGNGTVEIRSVLNSANGTMSKSTIIDVKRAWVLQQHWYNRAGTLLASAIAHSHRYYPEYGVSLPQKIEIRLPPMQLALSIDVGTVQLNSLAENPQLWSMPLLSGYPKINLGTPPTAGTPNPAASAFALPATNQGESQPPATPSLTTAPVPSYPTVPARSIYQPAQGRPSQGHPSQAQTNSRPPASPIGVQQPLRKTEQLPAAGLPIR